MSDKINKKLAEIKSRFNWDEPVYSKIRWIEEICLFISRWKYSLTSGLYFKTKYFIQRQTKGFDDLDKWNAGWFIARKAVAVLKEWRKKPFTGTGIKRHRLDRFGNVVELKRDEIFGDDVPEAFSEEEWAGIIDEIIFAFEFIINDDLYVLDIKSKEYEEHYKRHKNGLKLFSIYLTSLWD